MDNSGDLSDELDEFEASADGREAKKGMSAVQNKPYDEAYEISHDLSMAESFDGRDAKVNVTIYYTGYDESEYMWNIMHIDLYFTVG